MRKLLMLGAAASVLAGCASTPQITSAEYRRNWGLTVIHAQAAYRAGLSGRGVTVALIDCGLKDPQPELVRNLSPDSVDILSGRSHAQADRHGVLVGGPLGSAFNGRGLLGVAYNATLLSIRADIDGGVQGQCAFFPKDLARALDYAVDHKARIVVLPLQGFKPLGEAFETALARASAAGVVTVIAAGNEAADQPTWPGRYAADPRYGGAVLAVGSANFDGVLSGWSNRAGAARAHYLVAPGERVITDCGRSTCAMVSGTSFAVPYVAGALALVMESDPALTGPQAAEKLLTAAKDKGAPGDDPVYGRGLLDLGGGLFARTARVAAN